VTRGINDRCRKLRPHAELLVEGFGIPEQLRYAEMLHPEKIPDADEHLEKDATSAGTIEPKD
jgi:acyl-CoA oxidase